MQTNPQVNSPVKWEAYTAFRCAAAAVDDDDAVLELNGFGIFWIKPLTLLFYALGLLPKDFACDFHVGLLSVIIKFLVSFFKID